MGQCEWCASDYAKEQVGSRCLPPLFLRAWGRLASFSDCFFMGIASGEEHDTPHGEDGMAFSWIHWSCAYGLCVTIETTGLVLENLHISGLLVHL